MQSYLQYLDVILSQYDMEAIVKAWHLGQCSKAFGILIQKRIMERLPSLGDLYGIDTQNLNFRDVVRIYDQKMYWLRRTEIVSHPLYILAKNGNLDAPDEYNAEDLPVILQGAAEGGQKGLILRLDRFYDIDYDIVLCAAALTGNMELLQLAAAKGAKNWSRALREAARGGHHKIVEILIQKGARCEYYGLLEAAQSGRRGLIIFFAQMSYLGHEATTTAAANYFCRLGQLHRNNSFECHFAKIGGLNAILYAVAWGGHKGLVEFLLTQNNVKDINWELGLEGAARGGHEQLVQFFVGKGAKNWALAKKNAMQGKHEKLVQFFTELEHGDAEEY